MRDHEEVSDGIDLVWIPLGAGPGGALVRWSGRLYELFAATAHRRRARPLYHSALLVTLDGSLTTIEMAPVWVTRGERGVVAEGPVGWRHLGRCRLFRYEVRCWPNGSIPDLGAAVGRPTRVSADPASARRLLGLVPSFPTHTWGRDELGTGDMWNSNSLTSWLLTRSSLDPGGLHPPEHGRAPGWDAGVVAGRAGGQG